MKLWWKFAFLLWNHQSLFPDLCPCDNGEPPWPAQVHQVENIPADSRLERCAGEMQPICCASGSQSHNFLLLVFFLTNAEFHSTFLNGQAVAASLVNNIAVGLGRIKVIFPKTVCSTSRNGWKYCRSHFRGIDRHHRKPLIFPLWKITHRSMDSSSRHTWAAKEEVQIYQNQVMIRSSSHV